MVEVATAKRDFSSMQYGALQEASQTSTQSRHDPNIESLDGKVLLHSKGLAES